MPKKETFTSRFEETRGGRVPQKSKIWGDVFYGWSLSSQDRKTNSLVRFLEEVLAGKFDFDFYLPLACQRRDQMHPTLVDWLAV